MFEGLNDWVILELSQLLLSVWLYKHLGLVPTVVHVADCSLLFVGEKIIENVLGDGTDGEKWSWCEAGSEWLKILTIPTKSLTISTWFIASTYDKWQFSVVRCWTQVRTCLKKTHRNTYILSFEIVQNFKRICTQNNLNFPKNYDSFFCWINTPIENGQ